MTALSQAGSFAASNAPALLNAAQAATTVAETGVRFSEQAKQADATADAAKLQMRHSQAEATAELREKTATAAARGEQISIEGAEGAGQIKAFGIGESDRTLAAMLHRQGAATARARAANIRAQRGARTAAAYATQGAAVQRAAAMARLERPSKIGLGIGVAAQAGDGVITTLSKLKARSTMLPAAVRSRSEGIA